MNLVSAVIKVRESQKEDNTPSKKSGMFLWMSSLHRETIQGDKPRWLYFIKRDGIPLTAMILSLGYS